MTGISNKSSKGEKKYTKLLNNLLFIKGRDQTLFTKVNSIDSFDMTSKFSKVISNKVISQKQFTIQLNESDLNNLIEKLNITNDPKVIIELFEKYKIRLFNTKKILLMEPETFLDTKNDLLENLEQKKQKEKIRWKQYRRKILDSNTQDNIWPLHIATFFISIKTSNKELYGPLLLKEVQLNIKDEIVQLKTEDSWKVNEKMIFMLSEAGLPLDKKSFDQDDELFELIRKILLQLNLNELPVNLSDEFINYKSDEIKNKNLNIHPGVVLGLFKPSGGNLRKTMQEIIKNDEVEEILDAEPNKNIYKKNIENYILNNSSELIRIQSSNFSQDKALVSSMIQDTIIWGPPGTGKSQVIANIIANIFTKNKTAIVMSQKKAALDVLKKRLGGISPFALFILNDNKMVKSEFYKPLQKFVKMIENNSNIIKESTKQIITKNDLKMLETISRTKRNNTYNSSLSILEIFYTKEYLLEDFFKLDTKYKYQMDFSIKKIYYKEFMKINKIEYKKILWIKTIPSRVKYICDSAINIINNSEINPNNVFEFIKLTNIKDVKDLLECSNNDSRDSSHKSDEKYLMSLLSKRTMNMIESLRIRNYKIWKDYKRFANAVRAGRRLPFKFMNDHISIIKELFPIIITTPETNFINWEKNYFDYAILDESSQMFLEIGLPILYLAKTKILAGDRQQMQPSRWFATRDSIDSEEEEDVAENAESLLDYAFDKGVYEVMLNQNYRSSSAALMSFSAKEFYNSQLDVLDDKNRSSEDSITVINVNGKWNSGVNEAEAKKVIDVVYAEFNKYKTMIILTFNSNQRQLIEREILESHPLLYKAIEDEWLSVRNIENIQGDEADIIVVSVVYDATTNIASTYVARTGGKNALNVAISRAKDKMIVIKSITAKNIKTANSDDFIVFKNWLEFLDMTYEEQKKYSNIGNEKIEESFGEVDSNFEQDVVDFILENITTLSKIKLIKQYEVGSYSIDIALINSKNIFILGIEVDGYKYHEGEGFDKYLSDKSRQEFLESKGYDIYRIKEIDFKIKKDKIIKDITQLINKKITQ